MIMSNVSQSIMCGLQEMLAHTQGKIDLQSHKAPSISPKKYTAEEVRKIRDALNMSQRIFASVIGVSKKTVESWEYGHARPSGAAARVLTIAELDPEALIRYGFADRLYIDANMER
jgi:putative transcriptional regulator